MPPKRIKCHGNSEQSIAGAAECVLPEELMLCILTRLPVKSINRFKSVCKPWLKAFSSPMFRKKHHAQFSENPENQSIAIRSTGDHGHHTLSLLKIDSDGKKKLTKLDIPSNQISSSAEFIGCCNGLFCTTDPRSGRWIILWNPALKKKAKLLPFPGMPDSGLGSIGFGYNEEADDFTVVRISTPWRGYETVGVEVYSANLDSWTTMEPGFKFEVFRTRNEVIVNGSPYWVAMVDKKEVLVCFDVREMVFNIVPLPDIVYEEVDDFMFVDLNGKLGALVCNEKNKERVLSLDFWVYDDVGKTGWTKIRSLGTIELKVERFLNCLKNGRILVGECLGEDGKVFVYDTETGGVEEIVIPEAQKVFRYDTETREKVFGHDTFHIFGYTESLADGLEW